MIVEHPALIGDERILGGADFVEKVFDGGYLELGARTEVARLGGDSPTRCAAIYHHHQLHENHC